MLPCIRTLDKPKLYTYTSVMALTTTSVTPAALEAAKKYWNNIPLCTPHLKGIDKWDQLTAQEQEDITLELLRAGRITVPFGEQSGDLGKCEHCGQSGDCLICGHTEKPHKAGCRAPYWPCTCHVIRGKRMRAPDWQETAWDNLEE